MASNGGIIGKTNLTSFGKDTQTTITASGCHTTQPGTRVVKLGLVGGGGSGGGSIAGGGGGGEVVVSCAPVSAGTA